MKKKVFFSRKFSIGTAPVSKPSKKKKERKLTRMQYQQSSRHFRTQNWRSPRRFCSVESVPETAV
ncbi:hypothetical protein BLOT_016743 [Blomia tropicalis]|nr:hypothetical protein BLOT_016743 [Blomia tropicalis]